MTDQIRAPWAPEPATITDPEWLRQQYAAAMLRVVEPFRELVRPEVFRIVDELATAVLNVRDRHVAQLRQRLDLADGTLGDRTAADGAARTTPDNGAASGHAADGTLREQYTAAIEAEASLARVVAALPPYSRPIHGDRSRGMQMGWDLARQAALDAIGQPASVATEAAELRAAHIRDQSALAQIRLHIAVHRQRLRLADPVLLAKVDKVLREVGELEAAGGEQA
ncbi:hypothetical protein ACFXGR_22420 [Streptomyces mirabilis]|uniref:hypothetical protein n=1 Tax=Streptomyces mirabilis TaxID=68239 RepID=UPI0036B2EBD5